MPPFSLKKYVNLRPDREVSESRRELANHQLLSIRPYLATRQPDCQLEARRLAGLPLGPCQSTTRGPAACGPVQV